VSVDLARQQWEEGARRLEEAARDPVEHGRLLTMVDALLDELRRRVGSTYTLSELSEAYTHADRWAHEVVAEAAPVPGWPRGLTMAADTAFHLYARGAVDYRP
jgi:hypothetical protein